MTSTNEQSRSLIVLPESKVRKNARKPITKYEFMIGSMDSVITRNIENVLKDLNISIKVKQSPDVEKIITEYENETITDELAEAIVYGLEDLEILTMVEVCQYRKK